MKEKIQRFMMGRYGVDAFSKFLLGLSVACLFISMFTRKNSFYFLGLVIMIYSYYRIFSRDFNKRYAENMMYFREKEKIMKIFRSKKLRFEQRKTHCFFKCPNCKQEVRVPKGKGLITITCPRCKTKFDKKS